ncbi:MAG: hypothetical protein MZV70_07590 [Desulfobacterales bacterium]|nr:hypothetical protein [Desulfobacterales bacterium]
MFIPVPLICSIAPRLGRPAAARSSPRRHSVLSACWGAPWKRVFFGELLLIGLVMGELHAERRSSLERTAWPSCAAVGPGLWARPGAGRYGLCTGHGA